MDTRKYKTIFRTVNPIEHDTDKLQNEFQKITIGLEKKYDSVELVSMVETETWEDDNIIIMAFKVIK